MKRQASQMTILPTLHLSIPIKYNMSVNTTVILPLEMARFSTLVRISTENGTICRDPRSGFINIHEKQEKNPSDKPEVSISRNWSNMQRSANQIHKYSRQTREKSDWKTRIFLEFGVNILCSAEQSSA